MGLRQKIIKSYFPRINSQTLSIIAVLVLMRLL